MKNSLKIICKRLALYQKRYYIYIIKQQVIMETQFNLNQVFFTFSGSFMHQFEVLELREKAIKVSHKSFICYPGVNDSYGNDKGSKWLPKKGLKPLKDDTFKLAGWVKL